MSADKLCPDPLRLAQLMSGDLPEAEAEAIYEHVPVCADCTTVLRGLSHEETLLDVVAPNASSWTADPVERIAVERLIARLQNPEARAETTMDSSSVPYGRLSTSADGTAGGKRSAADLDAIAKSLLRPPTSAGELGWLGEYRVLGELGSGGMGVVFEAEDPRLGRRVAIKAMLPGLLVRDEHKLRFLREARAAASIDHDNIVPIHLVGEDRGVPFFVMPLLKGESLESRLRREGRLSVAETVRIGRQIAGGIAAAHERGLVHRDIKPANIWLEQRGAEPARVRILDFGLARDEDDESQLTKTGAVAGTPAFMSPEQARGERADARSDLFSIGCVLYCLLTGKPPFAGRNSAAMMYAILHHQPESLGELQPGVPKGLAVLVTQLLEKDPARRVSSANEVVRALDAIRDQLVRRDDSGPGESSRHADKPVEQPIPAADASANLAAPRTDSVQPKPAKLVARNTKFAATACILIAFGLVCAAIWTLRVETPYGTVVLDFDSQAAAGAVVSVDEQKRITLTPQPGDEPITLDVDPGKHQLKVVKPGFEIFTREFSVADDGLERIRVRLVPKTAPPEAAVGANPLPAPEPATVHTDSDVDRAVATWAHLRGARVGLTTEASGYVDILADDELPTGDFKLIVLDLSGRPVRDAELTQLNGLESLSGLMLHSTGVTDEGLALLDDLPALRGLYFGGSHLSDTGLKTIAERFPQIEVLHLGYSRITDAGVEYLLNCPQLSELRLEVKTVTDRSLPVLSQLHRLRTLNLIDSSVSAVGIDKLRQALPACLIYSNEAAPAQPARRTALPADAAFPGLAPRPARIDGLRRWQIETLAPRGDIFAVAWDRDGHRVACGSPVGNVRIIDVATSKTLSIIPAHQGTVWAMDWSPVVDRIVTAGDDGAVRLFDSSGEFQLELGAHAGTARTVAFSRDGASIASGGSDSKVRLWRTTGEPGPVLTGHNSQVDGVAWHPSGQKLASASLDGTVRIWDFNGAWSTTGIRSQELKGHLGGVLGLSWNLDGSLLASAGMDGAVVLWTSSGERHSTLSGHGNAVTAITWSRDGLIATSGDDKTVRLWQRDGALLTTQKLEVGRINDLEWSHDGSRLAIATDRFGIRFLDKSGEWAGAIALDTASTRAVSFNNRGELATAGDEGFVGMWNAEGVRTAQLAEHKATVFSVSWSPSGSQLVSGSWITPVSVLDAEGHAVSTRNGTHPTVWNPTTDELAWTSGSEVHVAGADAPERVLRGHPAQVVQLKWNSSGTQLASADTTGSIRVWNLDGSPAGAIQADPMVLGLAWHPMKPRLASGSAGNGNIQLWSLDGNLIKTWNAHMKGITALEYSPDGGRLLSSAYDQQVRVWDEEGNAVGTFPGPMAIVCATAWNVAGREIATAHIDGAVRLWDQSTYEPKATTVIFNDGNWARFDSRGFLASSDSEEVERRVVVVTEDEAGTIRVMNIADFRKRMAPLGN